MQRIIARRNVGIGSPVDGSRKVPVEVVALQLVHVADDVLQGVVERGEFDAEIGVVVRQDDLAGLRRGNVQRRTGSRGDGAVAHVDAREAQVAVGPGQMRTMGIEAVDVAAAAEEQVAVGGRRSGSLAQHGVVHPVVEIVGGELLAADVETRNGIVGRDPEIALRILGDGHADIARQTVGNVVTAEPGRTVGPIPLDPVQPAAVGGQPDAAARVLEDMDDVVVAERRGIARNLLRQAESHLLVTFAGIEDQQSVDRGGQHAVRTVGEQPAHAARLRQGIAVQEIAGMDETVAGRIVENIDAAAVGGQPYPPLPVLLDRIDLVVVERPGIGGRMDEMLDGEVIAARRKPVETAPLGADPDIAGTVFPEGVDHARLLQRQAVERPEIGIESDQLAVARAHPHAAAAVLEQSAHLAPQGVLRRCIERDDLGGLIEKHRLAQAALIVGREPQHVVVHVETHHGIGHQAIGLARIVVERFDDILLAVVAAETVLVHLDPQAAAAFGDAGEGVEVVGDGVGLLPEVLVVVALGAVADDTRLGGGDPHHAVRIGGQRTDAPGFRTARHQTVEPIARHPEQIARTRPHVDRTPHRIGDDGRKTALSALQAAHPGIAARHADDLLRSGTIEIGAVGHEVERRPGQHADGPHFRPVVGRHAAQPSVGRGDPGRTAVVEEHGRHLAAERCAIQHGVETHGRSIGRVGETHDAQSGDGHPRAAAGIVQAMGRAVMLGIESLDEQRDVLELLGEAVETVEMKVVGREPQMPVGILAHRDETVVRQGREVARRRVEIAERIAVEPADAIPRAHPHETARIGVDVGDAVVRETVGGGIILENALRRLGRGCGERPAEQRQQHRKTCRPDTFHTLSESGNRK